jgi:YD repeat-containing protein
MHRRHGNPGLVNCEANNSEAFTMKTQIKHSCVHEVYCISRNHPASPTAQQFPTIPRRAVACFAASVLGLALALLQPVAAVTFVTSNVLTDTTWTATGDGTYEVAGDITVATGVTLTIQPGVTVRFQQLRGLWVDGTLNAAGTAGSKITFTGTSTSKGWWRGILVQNAGSATIANAEIAYAGYYDNRALFKSGNGALSLTQSIIRDSSNRGLVVWAGYSSFVSANNQFNNNGTSCQIGINASFDDNTSDFSNNTGADVYLEGGVISQNTTWNLKSSYSIYVSADIAVSPTATLTVKPGTVVKFAELKSLYGDGRIEAAGTSSSKIHFTDWRDDTVGGDANKDATASMPGAGWWRHIHLYGSGSGVFEWCDIAYAGYYNDVGFWKEGSGNLTIQSTTLHHVKGTGLHVSDSSGSNLFTNVTASNNSASGMYLNNSLASVTGSTFTGNGAYGLLHEINDTIVYPGNTFTGNAAGSVGVNGGILNKDLTWTHGIDLVLRHNSTVAAGKTLTIENGVKVSAAQYVGLWVDGTLAVLGTELDPVTFTGTTATKGWWSGLYVQNAGSATIAYAEIANAGHYNNLSLSKSGTGSLSLTHSTIRDSSDRGLVVSQDYSSFVSANNRFLNNITACHVGINASFNDNTSEFSNNSGADVYLDGGYLTRDTLWNLNPAYSMYVSGNLTVAPAATLTIKPGTVVKFAHYAGINIEGAIDARGTTDAKIHFTDWRNDSVGGDANKNADADAPAAGWWRNIHLYTNGAGVFEWCEISYTGYYNDVGLWKEGAGDLAVQNTTARNGQGYGFYVSNSSGQNSFTNVTASNNSASGMFLNNSTANVTGSTFSNNGDFGLHHESNDSIVYSDNTFVANTDGAVGIKGGTISKNITWTHDIDMVVESNLAVAAGSTLTIEPGATLRFPQYVGLWVDGSLHAVGNSASKITFTGTSASKGWWRGVQIRETGSASLQWCEFAYAGYYDYANVRKTGSGSLSMTDCHSHDCNGDGLIIAAGYASFVSARNRFENNNYGCRIGINASFDDSTSDFAGNSGPDVFLDGGTMSQNVTWNLKPAYSFYVSGNIAVSPTATLTVKPGTVVKFNQYMGINVEGCIDAKGTSGSRIHFTDWRDDTVGGDANKNSADNAPAAGWWKNIHVYDAGTAALDWCEIAYTGYYDSVGLWKSGSGSLSATRTTIRKSSGYGLYLSNSPGSNTLTRNTFTANSASGMYLSNSSADVKGCTFSNNSAYGLLHELNDTIIYPENIFTGNTAGSVGVNGGTLGKDMTWTQDIDMTLRANATVAAGMTLTIQRGVTLGFLQYVGLWVDGTLNANGEELAPVRFTGTSATKGWWRGVQIQGAGSATLGFCEFGYGGYYDYANILKSGSGSLTITDSYSHHCTGDGLRISAGSAAFVSARNRFENNNYGCRIGISASFDDNTSDFDDNAGPDVYLDGGTTSQNVVWNLKPEYSFYLSGDYTAAAGTILTIKPGTVVKFQQYCSIGVAGTLDARGAPSGMIHFTDWRDDSVGGDANKNDAANAPGDGWWGRVHLYTAGAATMDWCRLAYAGYYHLVGLWKQGTGDLSLQNTTIRDVRGDGLRINASTGSHTITRNVFLNNWIGVLVTDQTLPLTIGGCRIENNSSQGSGSYGVKNTSAAITVDARGNWWGSDTGPQHASNPTGTGDRVTDRVLFDPWRRGQATAAILSPTRSGTLVAGDTLRFTGSSAEHAGAGYLWNFGAGRTSSTLNPGMMGFPTPGAVKVTFAPVIGGQQDPFPDSRDFTVVADSGGFPDLRARQMVVPATLAIGQTTRINYEVGNVGDAPVAAATWKDAIYLSEDAWLDASDIELGSETLTRTVAAGDSYQGSINVELPAVEEGSHFLILSVNDAWQVVERHRLNNELANSASVLIPGLVAGASTSGTLEPRSLSDGHHYRFDLAQAGNLRLHLTGNVTVYVRTGGLASSRNFMWQGSSKQDLLLSGLPAGPVFIQVVNNLTGAATDYTVLAERADLVLAKVNPPQSAAGADLTLTVDGLGFQPGLNLTLVRGTTSVPATAGSLQVFSTRRLTANFPGAALTPGTYNLEAAGTGLATVQLAGAVTIQPDAKPHLTLNLVVPDRLGYHGLGTLFVEFGNDGNAPMPAPLILLTPTQNGNKGAILTLDPNLVTHGFWTSALAAGFSTSIQILGSGQVAGTLMPGEQRRIPVYYAGWLQPWNFGYPAFNFKVSALTADDTRPVPWTTDAKLIENMRPSGVSDAAWEAIRSALLPGWGASVGQFVTKLGQNAAYLENIGERTDDVDRLIGFEVTKARGVCHPLSVLAARTDLEVLVPGDLPLLFARYYPHELAARFATGALGQGWTHVWDYRLQVRSDGMITLIQPGGSSRLFAPDVRGGYLSMPGDYGRMEAVSGGYRLHEKDGNKLRFDSAGRLVELRDRLNHTITLTYASGLLAGIQHSGGASLALSYQDGRITAVTDHYGRKAEFTYDAQGRMGSAINKDGQQTTYTYGGALGSLSAVQEPSGALRQFSYNSRHLVIQASSGATGVTTSTASYVPEGARVTVRDGLNREFTVAYDQRGLIRSASDPYGRQGFFTFDHALRNTSILDAQGFGLRFNHDARGNVTRATESTGVTTSFTHAPSDRLASRTDGAGLRYQYTHDSSGNLTRMQGPDGASWLWTYGTNGLPATFTDKSGAQQVYDWNSAGQLTSMKDGGGSVLGQYVYDTSNRLTRLTTPTDMIDLTYTSADRLQKLQSSDGTHMDFGYDSHGRRAFAANQAGHRVNYHYDAAGRLKRLSDSANATIVQYAYDPAGKLSRKTLGNGGYTDYETDAYGRVTRQTTCRADTTVLASLILTYDKSGRLKSHVSDEGTWQMDYDPASRVTNRSFTPAGSATPDRLETFSYDAAGELTRRTYNGTVYHIARDAWGRVTHDGERSYQYDADGRVISRGGPGGLVTYTSDHDGRVTSMTGLPGTTSVTYDAMGIIKSSSQPDGETRHWQVDPMGTGPLATLDDSGNVVEGYYQGLGMAARDTAAGRFFPEYDPVTGRQLFEIDAAGNKITSGSPPTPPMAVATAPSGYATLAITALPYAGGTPFGGFGMEPMFPLGPNELGLVIQAGQSLVNSPYAQTARNIINDGLRSSTVGNVTGVIGIITSSDVMYPLYQGLQRGGSFLHSGLNKLNVVVTNIPDFDSAVGRLGQFSSTFDKLGKGLGYLGIVTGGVEVYDGITAGKDNFELAEKVLHGGGNVLLAGAGLLAAGTVAAPMVAVVGVGIFVIDNMGVGKWVSDKLYPWTSGPMESFWNWWDGLNPNPENFSGQSVGSMDPNELIGPAGYGSANFRALDSAFAYRIDFENDPSALAPAQIVTITNVLSADLDRSAFTLTSVGFGDVVVPVGENTGNFFTTVDIVRNGLELEVEIDVDYNPATGRMVARFTTIDKATGLPPTVDYGFLPAEDGTGRGKGFVSYLIPPLPTLTTGTQVRNVAVINFDYSYDIATNQVDPHDVSKGTDPNKEALVTIDMTAPVSAMAPLPAAVVPSFPVNWSGSDGTGSGVASYTVYVSSDGGATWTTWLDNTALTTAIFSGTAGNNYRFCVAAKDQVGNIQIVNPAASVGTTVVGSAMIAVQQPAGTTIPAGYGKVDFGKVKTGVAVTRSFTIFNNGPVELGELAVKIEGGAAAAFVAGAPQATSLAKGAGTTFTVRFSPTLAKTHAAVLRVTSNDPHIPTYDIALAGTGVAAPKIEVRVTKGGTLADAKSVVDFGSASVRKTGTTRTFTITNRGLAKLTKLAVSSDGTGKADFIITPLKVKSLTPGKSATFKVTFKPKAKGLRKATIHIKSDDPNIPSFDIALKGTAKTAKSAPPASPAKSLLAHGPPHPSDASVRSTTTTIRIDGQKFRCITIYKTGDADPVPASVEVSSNLVDWFAGKNHTTVIKDTAEILKVRDNTPIKPGEKRYIRLTRP